MSLDLLLGAVVVAVAALVQGSVGFGLGLIAAPLLALIDPSFVPVPLLASALVLTALMAHRERNAIVFHEIGWALAGRVPGTAAGAAAMSVASPRAVSILVALVVFTAVGLITTGAHVRRNRPTLLGAGVLSGFMSTTTSIGGPPVAALYHDARGTELRAAMSAFFVVGLAMSLTALALVGRVGPEELFVAACLAPGAVVGFKLSGLLLPFVDRGHTRTAVLVVSTLAGISVLVKALAN